MNLTIRRQNTRHLSVEKPNMPLLVVNKGPNLGKRYDLTEGEHVLGRASDCSVVIDDGAVARHHCKISLCGDSYMLNDLKSQKGTFLNGARVHGPQRLNDADQIRVGSVSFTFLLQDVDNSRTEHIGAPALLIDDDVDGPPIFAAIGGAASKDGRTDVKLKALIDISQRLRKMLTCDQVLPEVLEGLFRVFHQAERGFIGLVDSSGVLVPRLTKSRGGSNETFPISRMIVRRVLETKQGILTADTEPAAQFDMSRSVLDAIRFRSVMCVPLIDEDDHVMGILQIDTLDEQQRFGQEDLDLLVSVASQTAAAIETARLHEELLRNANNATKKHSIFISYRRDDSIDATDRLYSELTPHFGEESVFMDVDNIPLGVDFRDYLQETVNQCGIMLVIIGDQWLCTIGEDGKRRLDDPADFVRIEIEAALEAEINIIPVLVGRASMPRACELPESIKPIAYKQAIEIRAGRDYRTHVQRLIKNLEAILQTGDGKRR